MWKTYRLALASECLSLADFLILAAIIVFQIFLGFSKKQNVENESKIINVSGNHEIRPVL